MGMKNPVDMILHMQPWMIAALVPFVGFKEGIQKKNCLVFLILHIIIIGFTTYFAVLYIDIIACKFQSQLC